MPVQKSGHRKVAVITGGTRGIGLALAKAFADAEYSVVITGRDAGHLEHALRDLKRGTQLQGVLCDVAKAESVARAFRKIAKKHSSIHVLVNNAGIAHALAPVDELPVEAWKDVIDTNLTGMFLVTREALPMMAAGSTIVNNLSVAAVQPFAGMSAYNASKFGAMGFTQTLREDVRKKGIRVLALLPGATDTRIWQQFWPEAPRDRMISPETVAQAVVHAVGAPANAAIEELRIGPTTGVL